MSHDIPSEETLTIDSRDNALGHAQSPSRGDLAKVLSELEALVPPVWPLQDYVAVNPFVGLSQFKFLTARQMLREVRDCELLPTYHYFCDQFQRGEFSRVDIESALQQCLDDYPEHYAGWNAQQIIDLLTGDTAPPTATERQFFSIAEIVDRQQHTTWNSHIINDITRHCSAHYDKGQAAWPNPWKDLPLYDAWREAALLSRRMDYLGIHGFRHLVGQLPPSPDEAIAWLLEELQVPSHQQRRFLMCALFSLAGWASFVKYRVREAEMAGQRDHDLLGLLAIRLAYDAALARAYSLTNRQHDLPLAAVAGGVAVAANAATYSPVDVLVRYVLQAAVETAHRRGLLEQLAPRTAQQSSSDRKSVQMIFCIDVRSEIMRRNLESLSASIDTFGFAGFFGMAFEYVPLGETGGAAQCPVLLQPALRVRESILHADDAERKSAIAARRERRLGRKIWKSFQTSAVSCFSFVESIGLMYFVKLLCDSLRLTRPVPNANRDGVPRGSSAMLGPDIGVHGNDDLSIARQTDLAEGMLRNLGLTDHFARIVAICGHAADVVNNPYKAGLDCGACGGHSGEPNARFAAQLLNNRRVRLNLSNRGIHIPDDTWFVPAVHNTTTDEIRLLDTDSLPATHDADLAQLREWVATAGRLCRTERCQRLNSALPNDAFRRSRDWSEVRPEWGLAGNAAFIVAPRSRTQGLNLEGRAFLHSYDHRQDPDAKVLELIMTAPMIVTSWINLQYYASTVDNRAFGSGNKAIHNVVGQFGVLLGNGGDLMTGLPWQSVHDGVRFQHAPLRLQVVIETTREAAQRVIEKHTSVRDLISNGWVSLTVLEEEQYYRWTATSAWETELPAATPQLPTKTGPSKLHRRKAHTVCRG